MIGTSGSLPGPKSLLDRSYAWRVFPRVFLAAASRRWPLLPGVSPLWRPARIRLDEHAARGRRTGNDSAPRTLHSQGKPSSHLAGRARTSVSRLPEKSGRHTAARTAWSAQVLVAAVLARSYLLLGHAVGTVCRITAGPCDCADCCGDPVSALEFARSAPAPQHVRKYSPYLLQA